MGKQPYRFLERNGREFNRRGESTQEVVINYEYRNAAVANFMVIHTSYTSVFGWRY
jgi:hypothetical protein